jgi:hypothetical protein
MHGIVMKRRIIGIALLIGTLCYLGGCAGTDDSPSASRVLPAIDRVKWAAKKSLLDPCSWVPLAGAAVCSIDDFDEKIVNWADDHHPVFSSRENADDVSDDLADILDLTAWYTAALVPRSEQATDEEVLLDTCGSLSVIAFADKIGDYNLSTSKKYGLALAVVGANYLYTVPESRSDKTRLMVTQWLGHEGNYQLTTQLKKETNRVRPNGANDHSFPSGHTSSAFSSAQLASQNLTHYNFSGRTNFWARTSLFVLASGTGWARVEANKHYPSDVLFGAALGNFVGAFVSNLLIDKERKDVSISINPMDKGLAVNCTLRF